MEMGLANTREQILDVLKQENFNQERTIDRLLSGNVGTYQVPQSYVG